MGRAHALAWRVADHVFSLPARPELTVLAGRQESRARAAAEALGFAGAVSSWRQLIDRDDIDVIDICTPVSSHAAIAHAALAAGKHVLCEKPLALDAEQASRLAAAAAAASVVAMVGYNYRRLPAIELARRFYSEGRIGEPRHVRARYLQDWLADDEAPWSWRLDADEAGAGALADLGSHLIDLVAHVSGTRLCEVNGTLHTFVAARPASDPGQQEVDFKRRVTVDDACVFVGRSDDGPLQAFETTRCALGRKNQLLLEIDGTEGSIAFNLERLNELQLYAHSGSADARGFRTVLVTEPTHPYLDAWWPPGHVLGWDDTFVHQVRDFTAAAVSGEPCGPDFSDGLYVQEVIDGVLRSAASGGWQPVGGGSSTHRATADGSLAAGSR